MEKAEEKKMLRYNIKVEKDLLSFEDKCKEANLVFSKLERTEQFKNATNILIYWAMSDELPTQAFIEKWHKSKQFLLPCVVGMEIEIRYYQHENTLNQSELGVWEPTSEALFNGIPDMVVVPGIAFDIFGNRMGRGKGYYDRYFSNIKSFKCGVCFSCQLMKQLPVDEWDIKMDLILSPTHEISTQLF